MAGVGEALTARPSIAFLCSASADQSVTTTFRRSHFSVYGVGYANRAVGSGRIERWEPTLCRDGQDSAKKVSANGVCRGSASGNFGGRRVTGELQFDGDRRPLGGVGHGEKASKQGTRAGGGDAPLPPRCVHVDTPTVERG